MAEKICFQPVKRRRTTNMQCTINIGIGIDERCNGLQGEDLMKGVDNCQRRLQAIKQNTGFMTNIACVKGA